MAIISHRKKFIFIHIYKNAGTTISDYLIEYSQIRDRIADDFYITNLLVNAINRLFNLWDDGNQWIRGYHKHAHAVEIKKYMGNSLYNQYYKFAFVRNPWDWQVSLYFYIKRSKIHKDYNLANQLTFKEFIKQRLERLPPLQLDFLTDEKGDIIVDKIGRFENLDCDFQKILDSIGIDSKRYGKKKLEIKNFSTNRKRDYKIYYDKESENLVAKYFHKDINYFNYEFN